jgi:Family of unknown function (DUF6502)
MARKTKVRKGTSDANDDLVVRVLEQLASIFIRLGLDSRQTEHLLRCAFVGAAERDAQTAGTRSTQSQIALIAGVTRKEVRALKDGRLRAAVQRLPTRKSRIERVVEAWRNDTKFLDSRGRPKPLTFRGRGSQFEALVKKHGRDVTVRTLREDLVRTSRAKVEHSLLSLLDDTQADTSGFLSALSDLRFVSTQLGSIRFQSGRRSFVVRNLKVPVHDAKTLKLLQRKAVARLEAAIGSLDAHSQARPARAQRPSPGKHHLIVTATMTAETNTDK